MTDDDVQPAWSIPVRIADAQRSFKPVSAQADDATRKRVAELLDLVRLESFAGEAKLSPWLDGVQLDAAWSAAATRTCGVTLAPFDVALNGAFRLRFVPPGSENLPDPESEAPVDIDADDSPEPWDGETIDVGALLVEHLALELDPFPRAPGAVFEPPPEPQEPSPFSVLAQFKPKGV